MIPLGVLASAYVAPAGGGSLAYVGSHASTGVGTPGWTFAGVPLGSAAARTVIVAAGYAVANGGAVTVTIGGVSATIDAASPTHEGAVVARASLPSGTTTGDVVVTPTNASNPACWIHVYEFPGDVSVVDSDGQYVNSSASAFSRTLSTASGGFLIACTSVRSNSAGAAHAWTDATEAADLNAAAGTSSAAHAETTGANVTAAVTVTGGSSLRFGCYAAAAYQPA